MEFVAGGTLHDVIYANKMSAEDIKRCFYSAVESYGSRGVIRIGPIEIPLIKK